MPWESARDPAAIGRPGVNWPGAAAPFPPGRPTALRTPLRVFTRLPRRAAAILLPPTLPLLLLLRHALITCKEMICFANSCAILTKAIKNRGTVGGNVSRVFPVWTGEKPLCLLGEVSKELNKGAAHKIQWKYVFNTIQHYSNSTQVFEYLSKRTAQNKPL